MKNYSRWKSEKGKKVKLEAELYIFIMTFCHSTIFTTTVQFQLLPGLFLTNNSRAILSWQPSSTCFLQLFSYQEDFLCHYTDNPHSWNQWERFCGGFSWDCDKSWLLAGWEDKFFALSSPCQKKKKDKISKK